MLRRVFAQGGANAVLSVSLPGFDAQTANIDQMCFDSRWSGHQFYKSGQITSSNDVASTFYFGETLDAVPLMVGYVDPAYQYNPGAQLFSPQSFRGNSEDRWWYAAVYTSQLVFRAKYGNQGGLLYFALFRRIAG